MPDVAGAGRFKKDGTHLSGMPGAKVNGESSSTESALNHSSGGASLPTRCGTSKAKSNTMLSRNCCGVTIKSSSCSCFIWIKLGYFFWTSNLYVDAHIFCSAGGLRRLSSFPTFLDEASSIRHRKIFPFDHISRAADSFII